MDQETMDTEASAKDSENKEEGRAIKLGWFEGVYMRCLLNIWGVMLFLRLTWVVGQAGIVGGFGIIFLSNIVTIITAISMSAVCTNGQIKGGGIYFMISRSLGPEFGGAIGLMFTLANSIAVSMYVIGFCESLIDMLSQYVDDFDGIISAGNRTHDIRLIGSVSLVCILALAIVGMEWVTRVQKLLMVLLIGSQADFIVGTFMKPSKEQISKGFLGYSVDVAAQNVWGGYRPDEDGRTESFFTVFSVFFPAVTGIVAGANLSGDLKDPAYSIPKGTLLAIGSSGFSYLVYSAMIACCSIQYASGIEGEVDFVANNIELLKRNITMSYDNCEDRYCKYGTAVNQQMMEVMSAWGPLIYAGCFAATLSSAITSLEGAPRVLQALAKDELFPFLGTFAVGWGKNNDPLRGYILVFAISLICILVGDLNVVSSLLSNFFVAAYALINFSTFHASINNSPGWRPGFKFYSKWLSLLGTILCLIVMFLMDYITALVTFICIISLYIFVTTRKVKVNWGSSTQAQVFTSALKASQTLNQVPDHVRNYRPKLLVMSGDPADRPSLIDFGNMLTKRLSLLSTLNVVRDYVWDWKHLEILKDNSQAWLTRNKVKAFHAITRSKFLNEGLRSAIELHGLGKLAPNMVLLGFKENWKLSKYSTDDYYECIKASADMKLSLGILRVQGGHDINNVSVTEKLNYLKWAESNKQSEEVYSKQAQPNNSLDSGLNMSIEHVSYTTGDMVSNQEEGPAASSLPRLDLTLHKNSVLRTKRGLFVDNIDIYYTEDDGGLIFLLSHILGSRRMHAQSKIRVMVVMNSSKKGLPDSENIRRLLSKYRIRYDEVITTSDINTTPNEETMKLFDKLITVRKVKRSTKRRGNRRKAVKPVNVSSDVSQQGEASTTDQYQVDYTEYGAEPNCLKAAKQAKGKRRNEPAEKKKKRRYDGRLRSKTDSSEFDGGSGGSCDTSNSSDSDSSSSGSCDSSGGNKYVVSRSDLVTHQEMSLSYMRLADIVQEHSASSSLVLMNLPAFTQPVCGQRVPSSLYMAWLDIISRGMPPFLFVRGNDSSMLTYDS